MPVCTVAQYRAGCVSRRAVVERGIAMRLSRGPHVQFAFDGNERVRVQQLQVLLDSDKQIARRAVSVRALICISPCSVSRRIGWTSLGALV